MTKKLAYTSALLALVLFACHAVALPAQHVASPEACVPSLDERCLRVRDSTQHMGAVTPVEPAPAWTAPPGQSNVTMIERAPVAGTVVSNVVATAGYSSGLAYLGFERVDDKTDLAAKIEFVNAAETGYVPLNLRGILRTGSLPAGVALDAEGTGIDITPAFAGGSIMIGFPALPPRFAARVVHLSGGDGATVSIAIAMR